MSVWKSEGGSGNLSQLTDLPGFGYIFFGKTPPTEEEEAEIIAALGIDESHLVWAEVNELGSISIQDCLVTVTGDQVVLQRVLGILPVQSGLVTVTGDQITLVDVSAPGVSDLPVQDGLVTVSGDQIGITRIFGILSVQDGLVTVTGDQIGLEEVTTSVDVTDNFGDGAMTNWVYDTSSADLSVSDIGGKAQATNTATGHRYAARSESFAANHSASCLCSGIIQNASFTSSGPCVRLQNADSNATVDGYMGVLWWDEDFEEWNAEIHKITNGVDSFLAGFSATGSAAPYLKLTASGTTLTLYESANGTDWGTALGNTTDSTYSAGAPGIQVHYQSLPAAQHATVDTFKGDDL